MKKILYFVLSVIVCTYNVYGAERGANTTSRTKNTTVSKTVNSARSTTARNAVKTVVSARSNKPTSILTPRTNTQNIATRESVSRSATSQKNVVARAAATTQVATETKIGAAYEQCKSAFFTCMDQFCELKNDNYRRCSCSDRVFDFQDIAENYQDVNERLSEFSENLDVVGMTAEQATAMKTASEGEDALTEDKSASKQLLQAIMNSISGGDTSVGGKYKDLNSITISTDISNAFGMDDSGQIIASYNGTTLYKAIYPKCRNAVKEDCNDASLQRAVNAYLMAIEQDCNTVETALVAQQKSLKASTHQNSAMLDLARVENRQNHNSYDVATCLANVETSIQSEEVCGANYHKCLDYGQFIDVSTGAPLTGVSDFYKLGELLTFKENVDIKDQKLSSIQNNSAFVQYFENKTKKFAQDSLDKCTESADFVWQQYLDRALIDIYYAQQAKIKDVKQNCIDLISSCYTNQNTAIANAMANLTGDTSILLNPTKLKLVNEMCSDYIASCSSMFNDDIIKEYVAQKDDSDVLTACRAIAQQCFDDFGGSGYYNFYYPQSGLFVTGEALDWFSLYDENKNIISPCAKQVHETAGCEDIVEQVFGGFDKYIDSNDMPIYSAVDADDLSRQIRTTGIATEVYYKTIDNLKNHCNSLNGYFVEYKYAEQYGYKPNNFCQINTSNARFKINSQGSNPTNGMSTLVYWYHFLPEENMCPANYNFSVDTQSWGACSCWERGGYRSKNGQTSTCRPLLPTKESFSADSNTDPICTSNMVCPADTSSDSAPMCGSARFVTSIPGWCLQTTVSSSGQLCPLMFLQKNTPTDNTMTCTDANNAQIPVVQREVFNRYISE